MRVCLQRSCLKRLRQRKQKILKINLVETGHEKVKWIEKYEEQLQWQVFVFVL